MDLLTVEGIGLLHHADLSSSSTFRTKKNFPRQLTRESSKLCCMNMSPACSNRLKEKETGSTRSGKHPIHSIHFRRMFLIVSTFGTFKRLSVLLGCLDHEIYKMDPPPVSIYPDMVSSPMRGPCKTKMISISLALASCVGHMWVALKPCHPTIPKLHFTKWTGSRLIPMCPTWI